MENSWIVTKPSALVSWQPKIDLMVASRPQHTDCYILAENDVELYNFNGIFHFIKILIFLNS